VEIKLLSLKTLKIYVQITPSNRSFLASLLLRKGKKSFFAKQREQQLPVHILIPAFRSNVDDDLENQKESLIFHTAVI